MTITTEDILQHHGVLGMKWGVRKKEPSNVTAAKQLVKDRKIDLKKINTKAAIESLGGYTSTKTIMEANYAKREFRYAKEDLSSTKILNKLEGKPKSESFVKLEEKYKAKGMNANEATVAAYKHQRTKNVLITTGVLALTAGAAVATYKIHDNYIDKVIKAGTSMQTIGTDSNQGVKDAFYTAKNSIDKIKYKGVFGMELKGRTPGAEIFSKEIKALSDIRQISPKKAESFLHELGSKNHDFAKGMASYIKEGNQLGGAYEKVHSKAMKSLSKGIVDKNVYEYFNATLVDHSPSRQKLTDTFFKELSSKGYNAIKDVNDSKYSGYGAFNPIIAFNTSGKASVVDVKKVAQHEIKKANNIGLGVMAGQQLAKQGAIVAGTLLGSNALINTAVKKLDSSMIKKYRKDNPGTEMSNTEIIRMLERGSGV